MPTVITRHPDVPVGEFGTFVRDEYGLVHQAVPQVRAHPQHLLSTMDTDACRAAATRRTSYPARIQAQVLDATTLRPPTSSSTTSTSTCSPT